MELREGNEQETVQAMLGLFGLVQGMHSGHKSGEDHIDAKETPQRAGISLET
jgi:hypothetical protein